MNTNPTIEVWICTQKYLDLIPGDNITIVLDRQVGIYIKTEYRYEGISMWISRERLQSHFRKFA